MAPTSLQRRARSLMRQKSCTNRYSRQARTAARFWIIKSCNLNSKSRIENWQYWKYLSSPSSTPWSMAPQMLSSTKTNWKLFRAYLLVKVMSSPHRHLRWWLIERLLVSTCESSCLRYLKAQAPWHHASALEAPPWCLFISQAAHNRLTEVIAFDVCLRYPASTLGAKVNLTSNPENFFVLANYLGL